MRASNGVFRPRFDFSIGTRLTAICVSVDRLSFVGAVLFNEWPAKFVSGNPVSNQLNRRVVLVLRGMDDPWKFG